MQDTTSSKSAEWIPGFLGMALIVTGLVTAFRMTDQPQSEVEKLRAELQLAESKCDRRILDFIAGSNLRRK